MAMSAPMTQCDGPLAGVHEGGLGGVGTKHATVGLAANRTSRVLTRGYAATLA